MSSQTKKRAPAETGTRHESQKSAKRARLETDRTRRPAGKCGCADAADTGPRHPVRLPSKILRLARERVYNSPRPVVKSGVPKLCTPPASPRSSDPCRGGVPPPPGVRSPPALWRCVRLRAAGAARKGGTPGEGSPFNPLLRFFSIRSVPRAAARGHGLRPWTPPAFL